MLATLIFSVATFTLLYATLLSYRLGLERMSEQIQQLMRGAVHRP
jgi:hypothetical protein